MIYRRHSISDEDYAKLMIYVNKDYMDFKLVSVVYNHQTCRYVAFLEKEIK